MMFWVGIVGDSLIGPFKVPEDAKMNSDNYQEFLTTKSIPQYKSQGYTFKRKCLFVHDNAPAHASRSTKQFLASKNIGEDKLLVWPPSLPGFNFIENLWSIVNQDLYKGGKLYSTTSEL